MSRIPEEVKEALQWIDKIIDFFSPYTPERKSLRINHVDQTSEIGLLLTIPDSIKRKVAKIKVPAYQNFYIHEMSGEDFTPLEVGNHWIYDEGSWILDPSNLPKYDKFFIKLRGQMTKEIISKIVFVDESENRDQSEEIDRYWLKCMIRDVELVENVWDMLQIQDVDVGIKVGINRCFSSAVPFDYQSKIKAQQRFMRAGYGRNRQELFHAWRQLRSSKKQDGGSPDELMNLIGKLTRGELFGEYLSVDKPYNLGAINREQELSGPFPKFMNVQALANLDLSNCVADGYLSFQKEKYIKKIKEDLGLEDD